MPAPPRRCRRPRSTSASATSSPSAAFLDVDDQPAGDCLVERTATVRPIYGRDNYGYTASGVVPDPACSEPVVPFIANWWSSSDGETAVLSNEIPGQVAIFIGTTETVITIEPTRRSQLHDVFGAPSATADAFGVIGLIPGAEGTDMVITPTGPLGGPLGGDTFVLQNYFAVTDVETGAVDYLPFFDPIERTVGPGVEVAPFLYDIDISATAIAMVWNTTPDDELPEGAEPNDFYPPYVASAAGLTQEQAAMAGLADEYWFDFDRDLSDVTFTVDTSQTLVPNVRIENGDTLVVSVPGGTDIGNGFDARILIGSN